MVAFSVALAIIKLTNVADLDWQTVFFPICLYFSTLLLVVFIAIIAVLIVLPSLDEERKDEFWKFIESKRWYDKR